MKRKPRKVIYHHEMWYLTPDGHKVLAVILPKERWVMVETADREKVRMKVEDLSLIGG